MKAEQAHSLYLGRDAALRRSPRTAQRAVPAIWLNLVCLDAPIVAVLWLWLFARTFALSFHPGNAVALFLTAWLIYLADRLADAVSLKSAMPRSLRQEFCLRHREIWISALILGLRRHEPSGCRPAREYELPDLRDQVRFLHQDITNWVPPWNAYDLVVTHFLLDCFPEAELARVIKNLAAAAKPEADWLLADFRVPDGGFTRLRARVWLATMYQFFRRTARLRASELIDPTPYLQAEGFSLARQDLSRRGMLKSELWRRSS